MRRRLLLFALPVVLVACSTTVDTGLSNEVTDLQGQVAALEEEVATLAETVASEEPAPDPTPELPAFPPGFTDLTHGGDAWAVVLAASEASSDPALATAALAATEAGYTTGPTDCDEGVAEILGLPSDRHYFTVSVYVASEADAEAAAEAFAARGVGAVPGQVQTFCLD